MFNLQKWQDKIKEKRKNTNFRDFIKEIASWCPFIFNKNKWLISKYPNTSRVNICSIKEFNESIDKLTSSWLLYNEKETFFENYRNLFLSIKLPNFFHFWVNENCDYTDTSLNSKNAYLSNFIIYENENIFYSFRSQKSRNAYNSLFIVDNCENIYFSRWIIESFKIFYSSYIKNSANIWFSSNLIGCNECILCNDLNNCSYYIKNKKYEKNDYLKEKEKTLKEKKKFLNYYKKIDKVWINQNSSNVNGNFIVESENVEKWYYISNNKNSRNVVFTWSANWVEYFNDVFLAWWIWWNNFYW